MQKQRLSTKIYATAEFQMQCSKICTHLQAVLAAPALEASTGETGGECASRGLYDKEFFPGVGKIAYEGNDSTNPLAFHYYNAEEVIMGEAHEGVVRTLLATCLAFHCKVQAAMHFCVELLAVHGNKW